MIRTVPDVDPPSLTLERFAAVSALIDAGASRDAVLKKAGLSREAWAREQTAWLSAMSQQARMRRFSLQDRFNEQLLSYLDALEAGAELEIAEGQTLGRDGSGSVERGEPLEASRPIPSPPASPPAKPMAPVVVPVVAPPAISYDDPPPSSTFPVPPPAFDFDEPVPASQPPASQAPSSRTLEPPSTTLPEPASALPFVRPAVGVVPPPPGRVLVSDPVRTGETYDDPPRRPGTTLPFKKPPPKIDLSETWTGEAKLNAGATLPFAGGAAKPRPPQRPRLEDGATPFGGVRKPDPPKVDPSRLASTMLVDDLRAGEAPALTLEQFASLSAEVAFDRGNQSQIEQRYGLDAAAHDREKRAWAARFLKDEALSERYRVKLDEFKAWLSQRRP